MILSETYSLIDGGFFDNAVYSNHKTTSSSSSSSWYNYSNILTVEYPTDDSGTVITKPSGDGTSARYLYYNDSAISTTKIGTYNTLLTPSCIEFDCVSITGSVSLVFQDNASTPNQRFIDITQTGHYKCVLDGSTVKVYYNDVEITNPSSPLALTGTNVQFRFGFNAENESIKFKDFVIYPI